ncbi:hypothetical protein GW17_00033285 [Ensete ventricosum]|nr:hypothetical protein GW17_00033285 [Ensete ventricosum]
MTHDHIIVTLSLLRIIDPSTWSTRRGKLVGRSKADTLTCGCIPHRKDGRRGGGVRRHGNRILAGLSQSGGDGMGSCFWETECFLGGVGGLLEDAEEHAQGDERGILDVRGAADAAFDFTVLQPEEEWGGSVAE